jgi:hypothetical protein
VEQSLRLAQLLNASKSNPSDPRVLDPAIMNGGQLFTGHEADPESGDSFFYYTPGDGARPANPLQAMTLRGRQEQHWFVKAEPLDDPDTFNSSGNLLETEFGYFDVPAALGASRDFPSQPAGAMFGQQLEQAHEDGFFAALEESDEGSWPVTALGPALAAGAAAARTHGILSSAREERNDALVARPSDVAFMDLFQTYLLARQ